MQLLCITFTGGTPDSNRNVNKKCQKYQGKAGMRNEPRCPFQAYKEAADDEVKSKEINVITVLPCDRKATEKNAYAYTPTSVGKQIDKKVPWK